MSQETPAKRQSNDRTPVKVDTNLMVLDSNNSYVNDLNVEDIKIFEDEVEQKVTLLEKQELKLSLALVVDNSGSMRTQLKRVKETTGILVVNLADDDEAIIIRFVDGSKIEIVEEWTADKTKMIGAIRDKMYIEGGQSAVIDAVYLAVENIKARRQSPNAKSKRFVVLVISDFEDRESYYSLKQLLQSIQGTDIQIFAVALTAELDSGDSYILRGAKKKRNAEDLAKTLGGANGGHAYIINKNVEEALKTNLQSLVFELRSQFVVSYTSANQKQDSIRKLRVEIADGPKGEKRRGFIRETVYIPKRN